MTTALSVARKLFDARKVCSAEDLRVSVPERVFTLLQELLALAPNPNSCCTHPLFDSFPYRVQVWYYGHECYLQVIIREDGYGMRFWTQGQQNADDFTGVALDEILSAYAYVRDSRTAASLHLSVAEWRLLTGGQP